MTRFPDAGMQRHDSAPRNGVLLANLGTPDAPRARDVRRFLREFLSDPRVIELPRGLWWPILYGLILPLRPGRVAHAYRRIWDREGSPLLVHTRRLAAALESRISGQNPGPTLVELGMSYGKPSIAAALDRMRLANVRRLLVLPLYPQYSATTTGSTFDAVARALSCWRWVPEFHFVNHYHDDEGYIRGLAECVRAHQQVHGTPERLLFSFHGLPRQYFLAGDPYYCHCQKSARLTADRLGLSEGAWAVAFQSRFGPREWLRPYTSTLLAQWGRSGVRSVQVICPGFAADCLETLEEIAIRNREEFLRAGGREYSYIPALNDQPVHVDALSGVIERHSRGWKQGDPDRTGSDLQRELQETKQRAMRLGAPD